MRIIIVKDYEEMSRRTANIVAGQIFLKPNSVIGLATGSTPLMMYKELVRMRRKDGLDFSEIVTFNLDEYIGLSDDNVNSYHYYMYSNLFKHINIKKENIFIPDGMTEDVEKECRDYEEKIRVRGGIDLQVLGIGNNGHIGFNEPDIKFEATTHKVKLDEDTILANARFFDTIEEVPKYAISMGIKTIMHARKILLLASGAGKGEALGKALYGGITPEIPASILQLHPDATVVVDEECAEYI
ncbi:MAG: glucosamine-6-phosphate deaminase [Clostridia bacterium BRH_c25]|nr:MAG: glucosamine-6-phosphate deaminase [Clostridia bacterium BRH_c25]